MYVDYTAVTLPCSEFSQCFPADVFVIVSIIKQFFSHTPWYLGLSVASV